MTRTSRATSIPESFLGALLACLLAAALGPAPAAGQAPPAGVQEEPEIPPLLRRPAEPAEGPARPGGEGEEGAADAAGSRRIELVTVPEPSLDGLEPQVAEQLRETRAVLEEVFSTEGAGAAEWAEAYGELGRLYHAYELEEAAHAAYSNARTLAPGDFRWAYYHGYLLQGMGRFEEAVDAYARAIELRPNDLAALVHMGEVQLELGRPEMAAGAAERALRVAPDQPAAKALLGQVALSEREPERAIELLEEALAALPEADRLHYPLGLAYRAAGRLDEAREHLARAGKVGVRPPDPLIDELANLKRGSRVRILRGRTAFRAGRYGDAAAEFRAAVESDPDDVAARVNLGSALGQAGDRVGAIHQYRAALGLDPDNAAASFNLGALLLREGAPAQAVEHLRRAADRLPGDAEVQLELGRALAATGQAQQALGALERAAELAPFHEDARMAEVQLLVALGRYGDAVERLDHAHALQPRSVRINYGLARLLAAAPDPAVRDAGRAVELARRLFEAVPTASHAELLAQALAEAGRCEEAAEWQGRAVETYEDAEETGLAETARLALDRYAGGPPCRPAVGPGN